MKNRGRTEAHVRGASAIHVRRDGVASRETKIRKLDDDFAFAGTVLVERPSIGDDKILRLNIAMEDRSVVAGGHCLTHLGKHRSDQAETSVR